MDNEFYLSCFIALGIPLLLLFCGALAKKIVRSGGWKLADFFLGVELALAALGSAMVYLYDLQKMPLLDSDRAKAFSGKIGSTATFLVIAFFILMWVVSIHQDWEGRNRNRTGQIWMLVLFCNGLGIALFAGFVLFIKGV